VELLYVTLKRFGLLVTPNAGLNPAFFNSPLRANRPAVFNPHFMSEYAVPVSLLSAAAFVDLLACKVP
jgi:hypothetical protein